MVAPDDPPIDDPILESLARRRNVAAAFAVFFFLIIVVTGALDLTTAVTEDRTFTVGASPRLIVHDRVGGGLRGAIEVHAGADSRLRVEGEVHGTWRVRYRLEQRGDDVVIEVYPRPFLGWLNLLGPARFTVTAPAQTRLDIQSVSAPIEVQGIAGGGSVRTTNGGIHLDGAKGILSAVTTNGAVIATGFDGSATLQTTNGAIDVHGGRGSFDVTTTNGAIVLDAELDSRGRHRAETTNGSVSVRLHGEPSLRVDARTTNGAVLAHRAVAIREQATNSLTGTIGAGEGTLSIHTTNGRIVIE